MPHKAQVTVAGAGTGAGGWKPDSGAARSSRLGYTPVAGRLPSLHGETVSRRKKEKGKQEVNTESRPGIMTT